MPFNIKDAEKLAEDEFSKWNKKSYHEMVKMVGYDESILVDVGGSAYRVTIAVGMVNEDSDDVAVEVFVALKDGRNWFPPCHTAEIIFSPPNTQK